ncbi:MAG: heme biosynthesis protein HemY, partial [Enterovirga sp.]|nr:heme biosynthesis protein HemY [Enterovirga sp.]
LEAVRLAPDLVPAAALAGRQLARRGDLRKAAKTIETAWRVVQHPDLAATYLNLRQGDSAADRLARAEGLARLSSWAPESRLAIARAAIEAREFGRARDALQPLLEGRPTVRVCLAMAELEQAQGATGRVREWLARAARAPRDPAWIADGAVSETWAPVSPVTGRLDAFVWDTPPEVLGPPVDPALFADPVADIAPGAIPAPAAPSGPAHADPAHAGLAPAPLAPAALSTVGAATAATEPDIRQAETVPGPAEPSAGSRWAEPPPDVASAGAEPTDSRPTRDAAPASPPTVLKPLASEPSRSAPPAGPLGIQREPAPVVFPVAHAPDDPGAADPDEERPARLRLRG